jgi:hypothetical protein
MARFYRVLPHELLDIPIEDFRLDLQCWRLYVKEQERQETMEADRIRREHLRMRHALENDDE